MLGPIHIMFLASVAVKRYPDRYHSGAIENNSQPLFHVRHIKREIERHSKIDVCPIAPYGFTTVKKSDVNGALVIYIKVPYK